MDTPTPSSRAGRYLRQPTGYRAFIPAPLPPDPAVSIEGEMQRLLSEADRAMGRLDGSVQTLPLLDGNGRVGRLLITFLLCEKGALRRPVLYLSHYFRKHRQTYYELLQAVRDRGAFEEWLAFFLRGVTEVSVEAAETARRILELREAHRREITERFGRAAGNGHRVLERLYEQPIVSVSNVMGLLGTTFAGANQIVQRLVEIGVLREFTGRARHRRFRYDTYVRLFEEEA